jgi:GT2 family glycosyltransferase
MSRGPGQPEVTGVVVICTRNRPDDLRQTLGHLRATTSGVEVLVADSSDAEVAHEIAGIVTDDGGSVLLRCTPGLARQRNQALDWVRAERPETAYVHFIDDDTEVLPGYLTSIEATFGRRPELGGVGGVVTNQPRPRHIGAKAFFVLYSRTPGRVLPSGRPTIGHYEGWEAQDPRWLPGCAMSYRMAHLDGVRFDDRLEGYSLGEDLYFSFALAGRHPLAIDPDARVIHHFSPTNRHSRNRIAREKVALYHRFVRENHDRGLRLPAFWWSVAGEALLKLVDGVVRRNAGLLSESWVIVRSAFHTMRHPLPARADDGSTSR